eukprot:m.173460 g.173460  ORF g.173460 m.173460 type:complete len:135 (-) comp16737_c0_seq1:1209-1613(-)
MSTQENMHCRHISAIVANQISACQLADPKKLIKELKVDDEAEVSTKGSSKASWNSSSSSSSSSGNPSMRRCSLESIDGVKCPVVSILICGLIDWIMGDVRRKPLGRLAGLVELDPCARPSRPVRRGLAGTLAWR